MQRCVVCDKPCVSYNYGVNSCNACKMFYRRSCTEARDNRTCIATGACYVDHPFILKCKSCRFLKCVSSGMRIDRSTHFSPDTPNLTAILEFIDSLITHRTRVNHHCFPVTDSNPTLDEMIAYNPTQLAVKPPGYTMNYSQWLMVHNASQMEFENNCEFIRELGMEDKKVLIKAVHLSSAMFGHAFVAHANQRTFMTFPDGTDLFPVKTGASFEHNLRFRLVGKLNEMNIAKEEFLLMLMIMMSNPAIANLSEHAVRTLQSHQSKFTSCLMQYCQWKYQNGAHLRYAELLSLFTVLTNCFQDMNRYCIVVNCPTPVIPKNQAIFDCF